MTRRDHWCIHLNSWMWRTGKTEEIGQLSVSNPPLQSTFGSPVICLNMNRNGGMHSGSFHCWSQYQNVPLGKRLVSLSSRLICPKSQATFWAITHEKKNTFLRVDERMFLLCRAAFSTIVQFLVLRVFSSPKHNQDGASQPGRPQYFNAKWTHVLPDSITSNGH